MRQAKVNARQGAMEKPEHCDVEHVDMRRKELPANPCREIVLGAGCAKPSSDNLKRQKL